MPTYNIDAHLFEALLTYIHATMGTQLKYVIFSLLQETHIPTAEHTLTLRN